MMKEREINRHDRQTDGQRLTYIYTYIHTDRQTDGQTYRQIAHRHVHSWTDKQYTEKEILTDGSTHVTVEARNSHQGL